MIITTVSLTSVLIYRKIVKNKIMNTTLKNEDLVMEEVIEHFNKKWKRASSIRKIKRKNKLKKMLFIKQKD
jgi:hypothetical protein